MDDVEESEEDIEDDHLEGLKDVIEGEKKLESQPWETHRWQAESPWNERSWVSSSGENLF